MRRHSLAFALVFAFSLPFLLGAEQCQFDPALADDGLRRIIREIRGLNHRVEKVEACACCCDGVLEPVCGSDRRTYVNACEADCAGAHPIARGQCMDPRCGGRSGIPCDDGFFCEVHPGCRNPFARGTCQEQPTACPDIYEPVCGCNGETYGNDCERRAAGAGLAHPGECRSRGECESNDDCHHSEVCRHDSGMCGELGVCEPRPHACPRVIDPVCGCDGNTYSNECEALASGVSVAHAGTCQNPFCLDHEECASSDYCAKPVGGCDIGGTCRPRPDFCDLILAPSILVCGCDGNTYDSHCSAAEHGVNVVHEGACEVERCNGIAGLQCSDSRQVCIFEPGTCNVVDNLGTCVDPPQVCPLFFDPVCGCDWLTYSNDCFAQRAGASIAHDGVCGDDPRRCGGFAGLACTDDLVCVYPAGRCEVADDVGLCQELTPGCDSFSAPVCGCDSQTYPNECTAHRLGVRTRHFGACLVGVPVPHP